LQEAFEVGWSGVGDEGGGAPVVEECVGSSGSGDFFDEELARAELGAGGWVGGECEEGVGRLMLLGEAGLDRPGVGVECGEGGGGGLGEETRCAEEKKSAAEEWELAEDAARRVHGGERG
jgi:hypothetical protein